MVVNDRRISQIMAAQPILCKQSDQGRARVIRCIFRCIREMLVCIDKIRVIREIRGLKEKVGNFSYNHIIDRILAALGIFKYHVCINT